MCISFHEGELGTHVNLEGSECLFVLNAALIEWKNPFSLVLNNGLFAFSYVIIHKEAPKNDEIKCDMFNFDLCYMNPIACYVMNQVKKVVFQYMLLIQA